MARFFIVLAASLFCSIAPVSSQENIRDCDATLIKASYDKISRDLVDWRMAEHVVESTYNQLKTDVGASGVIYGVPVSANYNKFQENIQKLKRDSKQSYSRDSFLNVSWTGLDPQVTSLYETCLRTVTLIKLRKPLVLIPLGGTASDIQFLVIYTISGRNMPNPVKVKWEGTAVPAGLPLELDAGEKRIVVRRPSVASTLALNAAGHSDSIKLEPLPPQLPPESKLAKECLIDGTGETPVQLVAGGSTTWACLPMQAGKYRVTAVINPSAGNPGLRVGYTIQLSTLGSIETSMSLNGQADVSPFRPTGLPTNFAAHGQIATLKQGPAIFKLVISSAHELIYLRVSQAPITIPSALNLKLERIGD